MSLLEDLLDSVADHTVEIGDVVTGRFWTLVASPKCGVASNRGIPPTSSEDAAGSLRSKPVGALLGMAASPSPAEASVGVAAINSLIADHVDTARFRPQMIPRATGKKVAAAGDFPFLDNLRTIADEVWVIEPDPESGNYTATGADRLFREADIALITGSTIVDHSLEYLLGLSKTCYTIVYGPSTPLSPILFEYGADQLVGVSIRDAEQVKRYIAGGARTLSECSGIEPVVLAADQQST
jgi:uncharacterized protein (DUF4213/DUF364 family)